MNNIFKALAVIVASVLFFLASLSAIRNIGGRREAGAFIKMVEAKSVEDTNEAEEMSDGDADSAGEGDTMKKITKDFDGELIAYLEEAGFENENYMVSPASLRAVLVLAVAGADSDTKTALIKAMGFDNEEEMNQWYEKVMNSPDTTNMFLNYKMLNSAWHNTGLKGTISDDYKKIVTEKYGAEANDVSASEITDAVNKWVNEGTEGLIPSISDDLSGDDLVLVNTIYLKSQWINKFTAIATMEDDFKAFDSSVVKKEFMENTDNFDYYEDSNGKLVVMPLEGGVSAVFTLGDIDDISDKMKSVSNVKVHIRLPKFEEETAFANKEMTEFIKSRGAGIAFTPEADFSVMSKDTGLFVSDIVQKTKIEVNEEGLEAAAATMAIVLGTAFPGEPEEIKEFIADEPFRFFIVTDTEEPEILFCGQIVK